MMVYAIIFPLFILTECQQSFKFIKGRSCVTQLILTYHYWAKALDNGCQVDVAFLDFSKAFDGVSHSVLLKKNLYVALGFLGLFLDGARDLTQRRQRMLIDGAASSWSRVCSGPPRVPWWNAPCSPTW